MYTIQFLHGEFSSSPLRRCCSSCPRGGTAVLSSSVSDPLYQNQGLHMGEEEEFGGDHSLGAAWGEGLSMVRGGQWRAGGPE